MLNLYKIFGIGLLGCILTSCSSNSVVNVVDNYVLGKDNTVQSSELKPITPKAKLSKEWTIPVGKSYKTNSYLKMQPSVVNNIIYIAHPSGRVLAVDKKTSQNIWVTDLKQKLVSGPAVGFGRIAVCSNDAYLILLEQKSGKELWRVHLSNLSLAKPQILEDKIIIKTIDERLYTLNLKNGEKLWVSEHTPPNLILKASSAPVIAENMVLAGGSGGKLDAMDLNSGRTIWQRSIAYGHGVSDVEKLVDIDTDPLVEKQVIYLATYQGYVSALSLINGEFFWQKAASVYKNFAADSNNLYFTDSDDIIWAISKQTGQVKWKQPDLKARGLTEPIYIGKQRLLVADKLGFLHLISTKDGDFVARYPLNAAVEIAPIASDDKIYVLTANGKLHQFMVNALA